MKKKEIKKIKILNFDLETFSEIPVIIDDTITKDNSIVYMLKGGN